jgi:hypothetical protein
MTSDMVRSSEVRAQPLDHAVILRRPRSLRVSESLHPLNRGAVGFESILLSLDPRFRPTRVVLIFDQSEREYARSIEWLLTDLGIKVTGWAVDLNSIENSSHVISSQLTAWGSPLPLLLSAHAPTLTGVAAAVFSAQHNPLLKVVGSTLFRLGARAQRTRLTPQFNLHALLKSFGARFTGGVSHSWFEEHLKDLSIYLVGIGPTCVGPLTVIQRLARETSDEELLSPIIKGSEVALPLFQEMLDRFESAGCLELNHGRLLFSSPQYRSYCAGGWLTLFATALLNAQADTEVHLVVQEMRLELAYPTPLEIVIPLTAIIEGQLFLFFVISSIDQELIGLKRAVPYLRDQLSADVVLLSIDPLRDADLEWSQSEGIRVCAGDSLRELNRWLKEMLNPVAPLR